MEGERGSWRSKLRGVHALVQNMHQRPSTPPEPPPSVPPSQRPTMRPFPLQSVPPPSAPVRPSTAPTASRSTRPAPLPDSAPLVLVLEDDPVMRGILVRILEKQGAEVVTASQPSEAFYLLASCDDGTARRSLALLDVLIPGVDGPFLVKSLRADHRFAYAPIVLLSGLSSTALEQTVGVWHADGYVMKSRGLVHVGDALAKWLARLDEDPPFLPRVTSRPPRPPG